jgi:hypothetical protein
MRWDHRDPLEHQFNSDIITVQTNLGFYFMMDDFNRKEHREKTAKIAKYLALCFAKSWRPLRLKITL